MMLALALFNFIFALIDTAGAMRNFESGNTGLAYCYSVVGLLCLAMTYFCADKWLRERDAKSS